METPVARAKWRGRRPVSLLLLLMVLVLTLVQMGRNSLSQAPWLASIYIIPQQVQQLGAAALPGCQQLQQAQQALVPQGQGLVPLPHVLHPLLAAPRHADTSFVPPEKAALELPKGDNGSYVAMCIIVKDEHCDIREWVLHHASVGVGKIYLFDTQSDPPMETVLDDLIASGLVQYQYLTNTTKEVELEEPEAGRSINWQRPVYHLCLQRYGPRHKWMGFFDADEFVMMENGTAADPGSLPALLRRYEGYGGLALHWRYFSFAGHALRPPDGVLASYPLCNPSVSTLVKSLVQPKYVRELQTVHNFAFEDKRYAVNTAGVRIWGPSTKKGQESAAGAVLHHYISRSLADFEIKTRRRGGAGSVKTLEDFIHWHKKASVVCPQAVPLGRALRLRYDLTRHAPQRCVETEKRVRQRQQRRGDWEGTICE